MDHPQIHYTRPRRPSAVDILTILLGFTLAGCGYLSLQQPTVKAGAVNVVGLNFQKADLMVNLDVTNPNSSTLVIAGYTYDLQIESQPFLHGTSDAEFELKPRDVTPVRVPVSIAFSELQARLDALKGKSDAGYALVLSLSVRTPVGSIPLSFRKEGRLPVLTIPKVRLRTVKVGAMSLAGVSMDLLVEVSDPGASVSLSELNYVLSVNGSRLASGSNSQTQPAPEGGAQLVRIPVQLDLSHARTVLGALLGGREQPAFTISGTARFSSSFGELNIPFSHTDKITPAR